ncbi:FtsH protease activity modulator HflK [Phaeovibrio sulfidiphilus]|uniref:Protein HflK n=1 Tax=Phaeovibrio sulfidiphilus TaxID=1220600 RepID=A0A8J6YK01_9PROT|nr:FtsH protease activity modulator HflK [Phaeovibrio sulfidiphilus]MBE1237836.1 FtsH protease activity modulator HflK [Phaeovibrio sulfidiphilus]
MAWNQQGGGGPWGGGSGPGGGDNGGGGPWGSGRGPRRPGGGGSQTPPPDFDQILKDASDRFRRMLPGGGFSGAVIALLVLIGLGVWMLTGFYRVAPDEQGVVLRFGKFVHTTEPGLHYHLPYPIETVLMPKVTRENRVEIGFETGPNNSVRPVPRESLMLTGDENIIDIYFSVVWTIKDAGEYLFNLRDPGIAVRWAAESAIREVVGRTPIQAALTEDRSRIEADTKQILQELLDQYQAGIRIQRVQLLKADPPEQVIDAFNEVQRARQEGDRLRNDAQAYANKVLPEARGQAAKMLEDAKAYQESVVIRAQGDAARFSSVYKGYQGNPAVTRQRIYIETMGDLFRNTDKLILDRNNSGILPYLPLNEMMKSRGTRSGTPTLSSPSRDVLSIVPDVQGARP